MVFLVFVVFNTFVILLVSLVFMIFLVGLVFLDCSKTFNNYINNRSILEFAENIYGDPF